MASSGRGLAIFGILLAIVAAGIGGYTFLQVMNLESAVNELDGGSGDGDSYTIQNIKSTGSVDTDPVETWISIDGFSMSVYPENNGEVVIIYSCQLVLDCDRGEYSYFRARIVMDGSDVLGSDRDVAIPPQSDTHDRHTTITFTLHHLLSNLDSGQHTLSIQIWGSEADTRAFDHVLTAIYRD